MSTTAIQDLPLDQLHVDGNVRKSINDDRVKELAASIKENGVLEPIRVYANGTGYRIETGQRRFLASQQLGLKTIPAIIVSTEDSKKPSVDEIVRGIVTNIQRDDLNPVDEGKAYMELMVGSGLTVPGIAKKLGVSKARVTARLDLIELPKAIVELYRTGELGLAVRSSLRAMADVSEDLAVKAAEAIAGKEEWQAAAASDPGRLTFHMANLLHPDRFVAVSRELNLDEVPQDQLSDEQKIRLSELLAAYWRPKLLEADIDAARAAGVLYEPASPEGASPIVTDMGWLAAHLAVVVDREHKLQQERIKERQQAAAAAQVTAPAADGASGTGDGGEKRSDEEILRDAKITQLRKDVVAARSEGEALARDANLKLGDALLQKVKVDVGPMPVDVARALVAGALGPRLPELFMCGARLCFDEYISSEQVGKEPNVRTKYVYLDKKGEALQKANEFLSRGKKANEVIERALVLIGCALYADQGVLPQAKRISFHSTIESPSTAGTGKPPFDIYDLWSKAVKKSWVPPVLRSGWASVKPIKELIEAADKDIVHAAGYTTAVQQASATA